MPYVHGWILIMTCSVVFFTLVHLTRTAGIMGQYSDTQEGNGSYYQLDGRTTSWGPTPSFILTDPIVKVGPSQMAILPCSVKLLGDRQVVWRRVEEDEFLTIGKMVWSKDSRILVEHRVSEEGISSWDLLLRNVQYNDAGVYECQVTSSDKIVWNVELKVIDPVTTKPKSRVNKQATQAPHAMATMQSADHQRATWRQAPFIDHDNSPKREEYLTAGQSARLHCNISLVNVNLPKTSHIEWYKDGEIIESTEQVFLTRYQLETEHTSVSELIIDRTRLSDSGNYLCRFMKSNIMMFRLYVLPNTTINSYNKEDQSLDFYAGDHLHRVNNAAAFTLYSHNTWTLAFFIPVLILFNQLFPLFKKNFQSVQTLNNKFQSVQTLNNKFQSVQTLNNNKFQSVQTLNNKFQRVQTLNNKFQSVQTRKNKKLLSVKILNNNLQSVKTKNNNKSTTCEYILYKL